MTVLLDLLRFPAQIRRSYSLVRELSKEQEEYINTI
jgi:hypothetical protein